MKEKNMNTTTTEFDRMAKQPRMQGANMNKKIVYTFLGLVLFFTLAPFILFGTNSIITVHDNLDSLIPWYKMFHDNGLFFKFDVPTKGFSEMSTLYYGQLGFTFQCLLYRVFDTFVAYALNHIFSVLFGILSMYLLLKRMLKIDQLVSLSVAVCYAILPVYPAWNTAVGTLPLIIFIFFYLAAKSERRLSWKIVLLLFYPVFSFFAAIGFFILGFWFVGTIVVCIRNKKLNIHLIAGFFILSIGYILVDLRLFYVMFVLKTPLNRSSFVHPYGIAEMLKVFRRSLKDFFVNSFFHVASMQQKVILPYASVMSIVFLPHLISVIKSKNGKLKTKTVQTDGKIILLFICEVTAFVFSAIAALYESGLLDGFIKKAVPVLAGFNWGRVWIFNRVLWMIIFALCLSLTPSLKSIVLGFDQSTEKIILPPVFSKAVVTVLLLLNAAYIMRSPVYYYNDPFKTWYNEIGVKTGIARKISYPYSSPDEFTATHFSYKEFFSENLFRTIKEDINYADERVAAFGYHPSVLMYNGFNCIDGYNNSYPLDYMRQFRTLIAPEFETDTWARDYYDSWGGRMYLYSADLGADLTYLRDRKHYDPTRNKNVPPVDLHIDMNVFREVFDGKYILSRAEIANADELGLLFVKRYDDDESIYTIYVYKTDVLR
jgi:hypothetical protein